MQTFADASAATVEGSTVETNIGEIQLSARASRIIGVWVNALGGDTMTSTEAITGILRLDSPDISMAPFKIPLDQVSALTSGVAALPTHIIPVNIPAKGQAKVTGYITIDDTTTGAIKCRWGLIYEGN
jgi:hypothetical protein